MEREMELEDEFFNNEELKVCSPIQENSRKSSLTSYRSTLEILEDKENIINGTTDNNNFVEYDFPSYENKKKKHMTSKHHYFSPEHEQYAFQQHDLNKEDVTYDEESQQQNARSSSGSSLNSSDDLKENSHTDLTNSIFNFELLESIKQLQEENERMINDDSETSRISRNNTNSTPPPASEGSTAPKQTQSSCQQPQNESVSNGEIPLPPSPTSKRDKVRELMKQVSSLIHTGNTKKAFKRLEQAYSIVPNNTKLKHQLEKMRIELAQRSRSSSSRTGTSPGNSNSNSNTNDNATCNSGSGGHQSNNVNTMGTITSKSNGTHARKVIQACHDDETYQECDARKLNKEILHLREQNKKLESQVQYLKNLIQYAGITIPPSLQMQKDDGNNRVNNLVTIRDTSFIRLFCRVRPLTPNEVGESIEHIHFSIPPNQQNGSGPAVQSPADTANDIDDKYINITKTVNALSGGKLFTRRYYFQFDKVFRPDASQGLVFDELKSSIEEVFNGVKLSIFAYGNTGSGKTYTMLGSNANNLHDYSTGKNTKNWEERGMIQRSVGLIFSTLQQRQKFDSSWTYSVRMQAMEIYNEKIYDLLSEQATSSNRKIMLDPLTNLSIMEACNEADIYDMLAKACKKRSIASTQFNEYSSRSHSVIRLSVTATHNKSSMKKEGVLNLIDLAGSEKMDMGELSTSKQKKLKSETQAINRSLSSLSAVFRALLKKERHVPYRNGILTKLLMNDLRSDLSKMVMIINISPLYSFVEKTLNSLQFVRSANVYDLVQKNGITTSAES